jgi:sugar phosphate isomerase/epimerase
VLDKTNSTGELKMNRRTLLKYSVGVGVGISASQGLNPLWASQETEKPKFKLDLCGGRVGIEANQSQLIDLASANGFTAVEPLDWDLKKMDQKALDAIQEKRKSANLQWSAAGLPVEFRKSEEKFKEDLGNLAATAKLLQSVGVTRIGTWIMPCHESLTYRSNFRQHADRLKEAAKVLEQHGLKLGLEYVGTKSLRISKKFSFVHTMQETGELIAEIGQSNVGYILDSWHWTMAGESGDDIRSLTNEQVVAVDLNDAPAGIELDQQMDTVRELPMATGVIKCSEFMKALVDIKYDGPARAEPFNKTLNAMDNEGAVKATAEAMKKAFATVGA